MHSPEFASVVPTSLLVAAGSVPVHAQAVDPPSLAAVPVRGSQVIRLNVVCFDHEVGLSAPSPCRGELMLHDAGGRQLKRESYELQPGQTRSFEFVPPATRASLVSIIPCVIPAPGGRAIPNVEVTDGAGNIALLIGPAVARMSQFQQQESPR